MNDIAGERIGAMRNPPHLGEPIRRWYSVATMDADEKLIVATQDLAGTQRDHGDALRQLVLDRLDLEDGLEADGKHGEPLCEAI